MSKKKIYFMGLLANVDSSILNVKLEHGFEIKTMSEQEGVKLISNMGFMITLSEIYKKIFGRFHCLSENKSLYYIDNSFECDIENFGDIPSEKAKFYKEYIANYLSHVIRLMRLFKEGNICIPQLFWFFSDNTTLKPFESFSVGWHVSSELYTLENSEIPDLQKFIQNTKLPFKESFLQLAFENFELSYQTRIIGLSFLSLMISLETLLNPGDHELRYRISRNTAVLLGEDKGDSESIFSELKDLYDKRSNLVHSGKTDIVKNEDLLKLRHYVRESIKEISKIGENKNDLIDTLNSCGFGERPLRK
ncbi:MAG: HEPN domain-containing protein [Halobacteriota archaeon]|nr:HEPN domain-containing protein [Halobacteriota archaeon]